MTAFDDPTTREALAFLREAHGLHQRQGQAVLAAGLAGTPRQDGRARRFDPGRLVELAEATELTDDEIWSACPYGVFIARVAARRGFHHDAPRTEQIAAVRGPWYVPWLAHLWIHAHSTAMHRFPFIATVGDFVVCGGEIVGASYPDPELHTTNMSGKRTMWELAEPGAWYDAVAGRRLTLGPGYPWKIWGAPVSIKQPSTEVPDLSAAAARAIRPRGRRRSPERLASPPPSAAHRRGPTA